ncbi:hypothetical protein O3P69_012643 [Scylla paramamosain]|uniref:Uncharacterized protein n=1 Tax=Scylla paramamosain TaxID=85552 RepID=A0AAW0SEY1_SCYPA
MASNTEVKISQAGSGGAVVTTPGSNPPGGSSDTLKGGSSPCQEDPAQVTAQIVRAFKQSNKIKARQIDEYCRGLFPLLFGLFNIFYWCYNML